MMSQVTVVQDDLSNQGLRRVHILSGDAKAFQAAKAKWWDAVPWESADLVTCFTYVEAGIHHFRLHWPARGLRVKLDLSEGEPPGPLPLNGDFILSILRRTRPSSPDDGTAVIPEKGTLRHEAAHLEKVSEIIERAAWYYMAWFGEWPDTAWVGERMAKYDGRVVRIRSARVQIVVAGWLAREGVGVGRVAPLSPRKQGEPKMETDRKEGQDE